MQQTSVKMYQYSVELNNTIVNTLDLSKVLQGHHMEIETKCHQEWLPMEEGFVKTVKWQEETQQKTIVQKCDQNEAEFLRLKEEYHRKKECMDKLLRQIIKQLEEIIEKRNDLIINLIKDPEDTENLKEKVVKL